MSSSPFGELPCGWPSVPSSLEQRPWFFPDQSRRVLPTRGGAVELGLHILLTRLSVQCGEKIGQCEQCCEEQSIGEA